MLHGFWDDGYSLFCGCVLCNVGICKCFSIAWSVQSMQSMQPMQSMQSMQPIPSTQFTQSMQPAQSMQSTMYSLPHASAISIWRFSTFALHLLALHLFASHLLTLHPFAFHIHSLHLRIYTLHDLLHGLYDLSHHHPRTFIPYILTYFFTSPPWISHKA